MANGVNSFAVTATSSTSGNLTVSSAFTGYTAAQLVSSAFSGVIQCQGSFDGGTTWVALQVVNLNDAAAATDITANGIYRCDVGGVAQFRWKCSTFTSATAAVLYYTVREG